MKWMCSKIGKLFTCFAISIFIYFLFINIYKLTTDKTNIENDENKTKSLLTIIDR